MVRRSVVLPVLAAAVIALSITGCRKARIIEEGKDYSRVTNGPALRKLDRSEYPNLTLAFQARDQTLMTALDRSISWYAKPSTTQFFPLQEITHPQAQASAIAMKQILASATTADEFMQRLYAEFDVYQSVGWNGEGEVLFTGYYSPIFNASAVRTDEFQYPLYKRPPDLVTNPVTGETLGRNINGQVIPYPTRAQIESSNMLAGYEFVYLRDPLDAYIIQVNGSAKLVMTDGSIRYIGYAGNNGHPYTSVMRALVDEGKIDKNSVNLATLRAYFREHPGELAGYTRRNDRFVFFMDYGTDIWPAGSLGVKVTSFRSLATDKEKFPRGAVTMVQTSIPSTATGELRRFDQFMMDQDTGGAIRAAGRADIYMGIGPEAEALAGRQFAEGRLYYFFLRPDRVAAWQAAIGK
ncbi:MAG: MltA domain-containing protein [Phycisphaeraceae bacterium]|nr:MltA domain-containing protein [Phycisphaeraceae bacterium]